MLSKPRYLQPALFFRANYEDLPLCLLGGLRRELIFVEHVLIKALAFDNWRLLKPNHRVANFEIARNEEATSANTNLNASDEQLISKTNEKPILESEALTRCFSTFFIDLQMRAD